MFPEAFAPARYPGVRLVAVTTGATPDRRGIERAALNVSYLRAIEGAGLIPLILAAGMPAHALQEALRVCAGVVLTGGGDVDPARYGAEPHETIAGVSAARDELEFQVLEAAEARRLPVLAICRGLQVLNVWCGGTLIQDIPTMVDGALAHSVESPRPGPAHDVRVGPGSRLAAVIGPGLTGVNSRHHQAIATLGAGLSVAANSADGVIEAAELAGRRFVVGVQWHPEDMAGHFESADRLFSAFGAAVREGP